MMLDRYYDEFGEIVWALAPANKSREGKLSRPPGTGCSLQTKEGLCSIHTVCKPIEGRLTSSHDGHGPEIRWAVGKMWSTKYGNKVYQRWLKNHAVKQLVTKGKLPLAIYHPHLKGVHNDSLVEVKIPNKRWIRANVLDTPNSIQPNHYLVQEPPGTHWEWTNEAWLEVLPENVRKIK